MEIVVIYASHSGNTESEAFGIKKCLEEMGHDVKCFDAARAEAASFQGIDALFFGCATYGHGELNEEAKDFFEELKKKKISLKDIPAAVFGLGESVYPDFASAVHIAEEEFALLGAKVVLPSLKIDMMEYDREIRASQMREWLADVCRQIKEG